MIPAPGSAHGQASVAAPEAIILSGPDTYIPKITQLYGGYKRTRDLYGRATYQKDPDQGDAGLWDSYIYWSAADSKWCVSPQLGAAIGELYRTESSSLDLVLMYQVAPADSEHPCLHGSWAANLYGSGARYQVNHSLKLEPLLLPREAADTTGYMHICARKFVDYEFPPAAMSIEGDMPPLRPARSKGRPAEAATWLPAASLARRSPGPLFGAPSRPPADWLTDVPPEAGGIYPVLAAASEYPGHVEALFAPSPEVTQLGKYTVWLFDIYRAAWQRITVDEFVPVVHSPDGTASPWLGGHLCTLWALLLEKALAKLCGSYEALRRSESGLILAALTGQVAGLTHWKRENGWWSQWSFLLPEQHYEPPQASSISSPVFHQRVRSIRPLRCALGRVGGSWQQDADFFSMLRELHRANALLFTNSRLGSDDPADADLPKASISEGGVVRGHGYSLLGLVEMEEGTEAGGLCLVQLRNVWGPALQWKGCWAEGAPEWKEFPEVRRHHLRPEHRASGRFWMAWPDFCREFDSVEVCPMPVAARKASHAPLSLRGQRSVFAGRGRRASDGCGLFQWRCCAVEKARGR